MTNITEHDVKRILTNPFYCLSSVHPIFCEEHPTYLSEEDWISTARLFIENEGAEEFLRHLLANLKGDYV